jgi:hypothetical protein
MSPNSIKVIKSSILEEPCHDKLLKRQTTNRSAVRLRIRVLPVQVFPRGVVPSKGMRSHMAALAADQKPLGPEGPRDHGLQTARLKSCPHMDLVTSFCSLH